MGDFDIRAVMVSFLAIIISLTVHEYAHAWMADRLGDPTPRKHGRMTLNPVVLFKAHHIGALLAPLIGAFPGFLIAWAATPVNPRLVRRDITLRKAEFLISVAGPVSNIILAVLSAGVWAALVRWGNPAIEPIVSLMLMMVFANVFLAFFNLIPIPPLDGFTVVESLVPRHSRDPVRGKIFKWIHTALEYIREYSLIVLILLFMYVGYIYRPISRMTAELLRSLIQ